MGLRPIVEGRGGVWACVMSLGSRSAAVRKTQESVGVDNTGCAWVSCLYQEPQRPQERPAQGKGTVLVSDKLLPR